ncbi:Atxe2 family lasso peptide isopeptidase [Novosphingobium cyanobacteriorum]|uniref:Atxe2 family lasso peptide isopeptidase n=1 Tax=Novosphingobium cyanobacteriorum TaxID=3024215 RepID=A0ABT6CJD9_9SPHN|nr:Atxe2 family lasso peptide isopeptidase [Novosphingobium cyanobacteriorum]MDF8333683.1 Atxe2 family lasso peptide isopeptidase [Novosphingobium cyanobacteriorum]
MARIDSPSISPDGRWALWRTFRASTDRNDYTACWMIAPVDGSAPARRLADAGEIEWLNGYPLPGTPAWSEDSASVLFRKVADGEVQVWRASADGNGLRQLTREAGNVRDLVAIEGGRAMLIALGQDRRRVADAEQAEYDAGTRIDASVDPQRPLHHGDRIEGRWAAGRLRGFWFEQGGILPVTQPLLRLLDPLTGDVREPTEAQKSLYAPPAKAFDQEGDWFVTERKTAGDGRGTALVLAHGQQTSLVVVDGNGRERGRCQAAACTRSRLRSISWMGSADAILFETRNGQGGTILSRWDIASGNVADLAGDSETLTGGGDGDGCAASSLHLVCVAAAADSPPRVVSINVRDGRSITLGDPNPALRSEPPAFERLVWQDRHNRSFSGYLAMPIQARGPVPLFVTYYACSGYLRGGLGDEYPLRAMASAGIATLCINRYPADPGVGGNVAAYRIAASGIAAIVDRLAREGRIDRARVGAGGVSFGSEVASWLAIHTRLLRAVSIASVTVSPTYYWLNAVKGREVPAVLQAGWGLGSPDPSAGARSRKAWRDISPAMNADRITVPVLMQVPEQEYRPNVEVLARLQAAGRIAELWVFPHEMHIKWQPRHQLAANVRNLEWFRCWLQGVCTQSATALERAEPSAKAPRSLCRWLGSSEKGKGEPAQPATP